MGNGPEELNALPDLLLDWYDDAARELPWRTGPADRVRGKRPDPYRVWLSEIMLQQTTIPHATRYFEAFTARWPRIEDLAAADDADVMAAWAGLGYYARARNLLKCARKVAEAGAFPDTEEDLRALPGIGAYTAGAVAAIAFDRQAAAVDGNVDRVFARLLATKGDWKTEKKRIAAAVRAVVPENRPGEFAEALMDLGATVCTPKRADCLICPLSGLCAARIEGDPERYPIKPAKATKPVRRGTAFVLFDGSDVLLERRPETGLLGGMLGLPGTDWAEGSQSPPTDAAQAFADADWVQIGSVRHVFTHFALDLSVVRGDGRGPRPAGLWTPIRDVDGLPSVFAKAFRLALGPA